jgi:hypothetical protein
MVNSSTLSPGRNSLGSSTGALDSKKHLCQTAPPCKMHRVNPHQSAEAPPYRTCVSGESSIDARRTSQRDLGLLTRGQREVRGGPPSPCTPCTSCAKGRPRATEAALWLRLQNGLLVCVEVWETTAGRFFPNVDKTYVPVLCTAFTQDPPGSSDLVQPSRSMVLGYMPGGGSTGPVCQ